MVDLGIDINLPPELGSGGASLHVTASYPVRLKPCELFIDKLKKQKTIFSAHVTKDGKETLRFKHMDELKNE